jgi:hypothetical protein
MRFHEYDYYKHENCKDAFIGVIEVIKDSGKTATVKAVWLCQGVFSYWWVGDQTIIHISKDQYKKWHPYNAKGNLL